MSRRRLSFFFWLISGTIAAFAGRCRAVMAAPISGPQLASQEDLRAYRNTRPIVEWSPKELTAVMPELKGFEPAKSQGSLPFILAKVGGNVTVFFHDFVNMASVEETHQVRKSSFGPVEGANYIKTNYVFLAVPGPDGVRLQEYRADTNGKPAKLAGDAAKFMLTTGFAYHSIYFHPKHQPGSAFRYLGRKMLKGRPTLLVVFAQRPELSAILERFTYGHKSYPLLVQGVAWIDPANYEIVRLRTDLLTPLPDARLDQATTDIFFEEKRFKELPDPVWLPIEVNVTLKRGDTAYYNQHRYSEYRLFTVDTRAKPIDNRAPRRPQ